MEQKRTTIQRHNSIGAIGALTLLVLMHLASDGGLQGPGAILYGQRGIWGHPSQGLWIRKSETLTGKIPLEKIIKGNLH